MHPHNRTKKALCDKDCLCARRSVGTPRRAGKPEKLNSPMVEVCGRNITKMVQNDTLEEQLQVCIPSNTMSLTMTRENTDVDRRTRPWGIQRAFEQRIFLRRPNKRAISSRPTLSPPSPRPLQPPATAPRWRPKETLSSTIMWNRSRLCTEPRASVCD